MKKFLAILLSIVLVLTAAAALAAGAPTSQTIDISGTTANHTYRVYQILTGKVIIDPATNEQHLTDIELGTGVKAEAFGDGPSLAASLDGMTEEELMQWIAENKTNFNTYTTYQSTGTTAKIPVGVQGYYLIIDEPNSLEGKHEAYTNYIVRVVGADQPVSLNVKSSTPTVEKKVQEDDKTVSGESHVPGSLGSGWNDVADYDIGEHVPFVLTATMPSTYSDYDTYYMAFEDTLSDGLTYDAGSMKVYLQHTDGSLVETSVFANEINGNSLKVYCENTKVDAAIDAGTKIIVSYTATLNSKAVVGLPGNKNSVKLIYSNNPTVVGDGENNRGETPEDEVIVFTYELEVTKINAQQNAQGDHTKLPGAKFVLYKNVEGIKHYAIQSEDGLVWTGDWDKEAKSGSATVFETDANGKITITGLDAGHYFLSETEAPLGYSELKEDIEFAINATTDNSQTWNGQPASALTSIELDVQDPNKMSEAGNADVTTGKVELTVKNTSQSQLPTTGSEGTVMMMILGVMILAGTGVLVIGHSKRRMFRA